MDTRLTSAVVGCGRMGAFTSESVRRHAPAFWFPLSHAEAVLAHDRLLLKALCDVDAAAAERAAAAYGVDATFTDVDRMLAEVQPALLCVATRTPGRAALIADAIGGGVRALHVEKPLCNGARELSELGALLGRPDIFLTYGAVRRFLASYRLAKEMVDSGQYGPLREIRIAMGGPGALFWTHPHSVDLILFAAGARQIAGVQARLAGVESASSPTEIESDPTVVSATVYFEDGVVGQITRALGVDFTLSCAQAEIVVRANGGVIEIHAPHDGSIYATAKPYEPASWPSRPGGTLAPISQLVDCLDGDEAAIALNATVKGDVLRGQQIAFAMLQSHLQGSRIVEPDAIDPAIFIHARTDGRNA